MEFGVHLPILALPEQSFSLARLADCARVAERLGCTTLCANDHLTFSRPWLDSLTALAAALPSTNQIALMTTVALPVVRGPAQLAKALAALDLLSGGRVVAGVGPGSSPQDYALVGIPFEGRWKRLDEAIPLLRSLLSGRGLPFEGRYYSAGLPALEPFSARESGLPIWVGSWGSDAGLRRVARLGDGWLASAYHVTPETFADALRRLREHLRAIDKEPTRFPHALGTMFMQLTDDRRRAEESIGILGAVLNRPVEHLRQRLLIGSPAECTEKLTRLQEAGVQKVFLWPVGDEVEQLERFQEQVRPELPDEPDRAQ
jgi:alkanesulfonate monooxygenase SsuD/methylene tetrahydromethanopterin reductase-like flavin-dependent oxidoreductase (luciferase family)